MLQTAFWNLNFHIHENVWRNMDDNSIDSLEFTQFIHLA